MKKTDSLPATIRPLENGTGFEILDQSALPHRQQTLRIQSLAEAAQAIRAMQVRGAPLIGVTAAFGLALALQQSADDASLDNALATLAATRPTAVNLKWALDRLHARLQGLPASARGQAAWAEAAQIAADDARSCRQIGEHGLALLRAIEPKRTRLNLMTHCNAGTLATAGDGTALAPIYAAVAAGIDVHVWVSETRPRNQGLLTAWELAARGVPISVVADNAAGILLAQGKVDAVIVGADRIAANGDVANKVGTYLKALAARAASIPFFVAAPVSTLDFACANGAAIPIEERDGDELRWVEGLAENGESSRLRQIPAQIAVANPAFDVTPAELVTAIITEHGAFATSGDALAALKVEAGA